MEKFELDPILVILEELGKRTPTEHVEKSQEIGNTIFYKMCEQQLHPFVAAITLGTLFFSVLAKINEQIPIMNAELAKKK